VNPFTGKKGTKQRALGALIAVLTLPTLQRIHELYGSTQPMPCGGGWRPFVLGLCPGDLPEAFAFRRPVEARAIAIRNRLYHRLYRAQLGKSAARAGAIQVQPQSLKL
jgi:hypothetical protein